MEVNSVNIQLAPDTWEFPLGTFHLQKKFINYSKPFGLGEQFTSQPLGERSWV